VFTAAKVYRAARLHAPELRKLKVEGDSVAAAFNAALLDLVLEVVDTDTERLAKKFAVEAAVVAASAEAVDLTAAVVNAVVTTAEREWLWIEYIDWLDAEGEGDEVWITTLEARNRARHDHQGHVVGFLDDQLRRLVKVDGWTDVVSLEVYGILRPAEVAPGALDTLQFDYPAVVENALAWEMVMQLAGDVVSGSRLQVWEARREQARGRIAGAGTGIGSRIEEVPLNYEI
jgi:hypothetical protein